MIDPSPGRKVYAESGCACNEVCRTYIAHIAPWSSIPRRPRARGIGSDERPHCRCLALGRGASHVYDVAMVFALPWAGRGWRHRARRPMPFRTAVIACAAFILVAGVSFAKEGKPDKDEKSAPTAEEPEPSETDGKKSGKPKGDVATATLSPTAAAVAAPGGADAGERPRPTIMWLDAGFRSDIGLLLMRTNISRFEEEEDFDVKSFGPMFHMGLMTKFFWKFRIGAALGYGFNFKLVERLTRFEEEEEVEAEEWILGQLYTADVRLEFSQELTEGLFVVATPRGGIQAVVPGEDLRAETDAYEGAYNVRQGPQFGIIGGIDMGARYLVVDWLSVRLTGGYAYYTQGLLRARRRSETVSYNALWRLSGARVGANLALEANF